MRRYLTRKSFRAILVAVLAIGAAHCGVQGETDEFVSSGADDNPNYSLLNGKLRQIPTPSDRHYYSFFVTAVNLKNGTIFKDHDIIVEWCMNHTCQKTSDRNTGSDGAASWEKDTGRLGFGIVDSIENQTYYVQILNKNDRNSSLALCETKPVPSRFDSSGVAAISLTDCTVKGHGENATVTAEIRKNTVLCPFGYEPQPTAGKCVIDLHASDKVILSYAFVLSEYAKPSCDKSSTDYCDPILDVKIKKNKDGQSDDLVDEETDVKWDVITGDVVADTEWRNAGEVDLTDLVNSQWEIKIKDNDKMTGDEDILKVTVPFNDHQLRYEQRLFVSDFRASVMFGFQPVVK